MSRIPTWTPIDGASINNPRIYLELAAALFTSLDMTDVPEIQNGPFVNGATSHPCEIYIYVLGRYFYPLNLVSGYTSVPTGGGYVAYLFSKGEIGRNKILNTSTNGSALHNFLAVCKAAAYYSVPLDTIYTESLLPFEETAEEDADAVDWDCGLITNLRLFADAAWAL